MGKVEVCSEKRLLDDFFRVDEATLSFERFDGSMSPRVRRLVFERGDSAAALVFERDANVLLFTEQFRFPAYRKGEGWPLELMAGMVEEGETPEATVRRECEEELGYRPGNLEPVATFFVSPGGSSERIHLFYAEVTAAMQVGKGGGVAGEHEDIRIVRRSVDETRAALAAGRLTDAKTIIAVQWFLNHGLHGSV
jgi:ADP-ribose pyrophosphatase